VCVRARVVPNLGPRATQTNTHDTAMVVGVTCVYVCVCVCVYVCVYAGVLVYVCVCVCVLA